MPWPSTPTYNSSAVDNALDKPVDAIPAIKGVIDDVTAIIAARAAASGICDLDAEGRVPSARLPTSGAYQAQNAILTAIAGVSAAANRLIYLTGADSAGVATLSDYMRNLLATADGPALCAAIGLEIGTDVQAFSAALAAISALSGAGLPRRAEDGTWALDSADYLTDVTLSSYALRDWVNAQIEALLGDEDPFPQYLTTEETELLYLRMEDAGAFGLELLAAAAVSDARTLLGVGSVDNAGSGAINYERVALAWASNIAQLIVSQGGTGTQRDLQLALGATYWQLKADGTLWVEVSGQTPGNARGAGAVDLCTTRTNASQVASGPNSFNMGKSSTASAPNTFAGGEFSAASGDTSLAWGYSCLAQSSRGFAFGNYALAERRNMWAFGFGGTVQGQNQYHLMGGRIDTTNATQTLINAGGSTNNYFTVPAKSVVSARGMIVAMKSDYSAGAYFTFEAAIRRDNANNVVMLGAATVTAVHVEAGLSGLSSSSIAVDADTTNYALRVRVTGLASTNIRWSLAFTGVQVIQA